MSTLKSAFTLMCFAVLCCEPAMQQRWAPYEVPPNNACQTPLGARGLCVSLRNCQEVLRLYEQLSVNQATRYSSALRNICYNRVTADNYPIVCCMRPSFDDSNQGSDNTTTTPASSTTTTTPSTTSTETITTTRATTTTATKTNTEDRSGSEKCRVPHDGSDGTCRPLQNCTELLTRAQLNPTDREFRKQLELSNAICYNIGTNICCPTKKQTATRTNKPEWHLPSEDEGCGVTRVSAMKVVGGRESQIGAWPWMALLGYDRYSLKPFRCGGSLITARHVLSAAHCVLRELSFVRLGEFDLSTETETKHVDIDVVKTALHPNFGGRDRRYDIAILYLQKNVEFTDYICPICLPITVPLKDKSYVGYSPYVAGWGRVMEGGRSSNVLQELQILVMENSVCRQTYEANGRLVSNEQFDEMIVCAGDLGGGRDTCGGDSGGPLMVAEPYKGITHFYALGVVSYGIGCARIGIPGVYTNVQKYSDWIVEKLADT